MKFIYKEKLMMGILFSFMKTEVYPEELKSICFSCQKQLGETVVYSYDNKHCSQYCADRTLYRLGRTHSHIDLKKEVQRISPIPAPTDSVLARFDAIEVD